MATEFSRPKGFDSLATGPFSLEEVPWMYGAVAGSGFGGLTIRAGAAMLLENPPVRKGTVSKEAVDVAEEVTRDHRGPGSSGIPIGPLPFPPLSLGDTTGAPGSGSLR